MRCDKLTLVADCAWNRYQGQKPDKYPVPKIPESLSPSPTAVYGAGGRAGRQAGRQTET